MNRFPHDPNSVVDVSAFLATMPPVSDEQAALNRQINARERQLSEAKYGHLHPLAALHKGMEDKYNETHGVTGWELKDIPFVADEFWNELIEILGDGNIKVIVMTGRTFKNNTTRRGSILISPEGMKRLKNHVQKKKEVPH